ncbi:hypothetical protein [Rhodothermus marinus]|uniref:hypothetical protein n=1 Tax=Rhodothermus marinus TaxID=29549 RepID=UPI001FB22970|nr:hypothetical protein [Rhodothermus marinus]
MPELPWASGAVFNPGAWYDGARVHLLVRGVPAGYRRIRLTDTRPGEPEWGFEPYVSYIAMPKAPTACTFPSGPNP